MKLPDLIDQLMVEERCLSYAIKNHLRFERSLSMFVNAYVSEPGLPKKEFKKALGRSDKMLKRYAETGDPGDMPPEILIEVDEMLAVIAAMESRRKPREKAIAKLAKQLPVYDWWASNPGLAAKGLGRVVGEAGDISGYRSTAGLWKRMGLYCMHGAACGTCARKDFTPKPTKDEWVAAGYSPRRRAVVFTVTDSLLRKQRRKTPAAKKLPDDKLAEMEPTKRWTPDGRYGELAIERYKETFDNRDWKPARRNLDCNRIVSKAVLADLHKEWKHAV